MKISELCIRRPVMTTLLMVSIMLGGLFAYRQLPIAAIPRIDIPTITVSARLPGASPDTMAISVAAPLERQFSSIAGITDITSTSAEGSTQVTLEFTLDRDIDAAALDVQSAISVATRRLPDDLQEPPSFRKVNPADNPVIFLAVTSDTMPTSEINEFAETVMLPRLSTLPGVGQVDINGAQKRAVRIRYDLDALAARNISIEELRTAVTQIAGIGPLGSIRTDRQVYVLETKSAQPTAAYFKPVVIAWRNGAPVRLQDVAEVADSVEDEQAYAALDGKRSIIISVRRQPDANTVEVTDGVRAMVPQFQKDMPPAMNLHILSDRSESIRDSVHDVQLTLIITAILVILVILAFLRNWRATLIPSFALPLSIVGTFAGMAYFGFSLDNVTLLALTLALGFVVDDAIIVLENIVRYVEKGMAPMEAAITGAREIGFTVLSVTLSLVAVFIPILLMGGVVGRFFFSFAVTISIAIMFSGFIALTLTPMLCARMLSQNVVHEEKPGLIGRIFEGGYSAMASGYRRSLDWSLRHQSLMLMLTVATMVATVWAFATVKKGFLPTEDTSIIIVRTEAQPDISFPAMLERQERVAEAVRADPDVLYINSSVASTSWRPTINRGSLFVQLKPRHEREGRASITDVQHRMRSKVAGIVGIRSFPVPLQNLRIGSRSGSATYQYTLAGVDREVLYEGANRLVERLKTTPGFADVTSDLELGARQVTIDVDRDALARYGVSMETLRSTLYSTFGTRNIATVFTAANDYPVIVEANKNYQLDPSVLNRVYVRASSGQLVRFDTLARVTLGSGPLTVARQSQLPAVTVTFNLGPGFTLGEAVAKMAEVEREVDMPAGIRGRFAGTAQVFQESFRNQPILILAAVLTIYIVLGILYESFIHPITILSGLPSASLGALLTLILFDVELTIIAMIGIILLIGIVKKNAIMMIDFAIEARSRGMEPVDAIRQACLLRFRPIMMTTMAALFGVLPIAVGWGAGAELRQPLGLAVVGGLAVSQFLTLYITPAVYLLLEQVGTRLGAGRREELPAETSETVADQAAPVRTAAE